MVERNNIGKIIYERRKARGLSLQDLAAKSDVSASHLGRVERGERSPSVEILRRISEPLGFKDGALLLLAAGYAESGKLDPQFIKGFAQVLLELHHVLTNIAPTLEDIAKR